MCFEQCHYLKGQTGEAVGHAHPQLINRVVLPLLRLHPKQLLKVKVLAHEVDPAPHTGQGAETRPVLQLGVVQLLTPK